MSSDTLQLIESSILIASLKDDVLTMTRSDMIFIKSKSVQFS